MTEKEFFSKYIEIGREIDLKCEEIERLKALERKCTTSYSLSSGGTPDKDKLPKVVERLENAQKELAQSAESLAEARESILAIINALPAKYREIMHQRYILGKKWDKISNDMGYDLRWIYRLHNQALQKSKSIIENFDHCKPL